MRLRVSGSVGSKPSIIILTNPGLGVPLDEVMLCASASFLYDTVRCSERIILARRATGRLCILRPMAAR